MRTSRSVRWPGAGMSAQGAAPQKLSQNRYSCTKPPGLLSCQGLPMGDQDPGVLEYS